MSWRTAMLHLSSEPGKNTVGAGSVAVVVVVPLVEAPKAIAVAHPRKHVAVEVGKLAILKDCELPALRHQEEEDTLATVASRLDWDPTVGKTKESTAPIVTAGSRS